MYTIKENKMNSPTVGRVEMKEDGSMIYHQEGQESRPLAEFEGQLALTAAFHQQIGFRAYLYGVKMRRLFYVSMFANVLMLAVFYWPK